ncbi:hypothetical protein PQU92_02085 [Asticcacaulis sp. BYS171W]|uniref:Uncharacterized protein n=1 Tax=Asticcacaulis aquaticus TaxID=2984212 RepID=A0ABT5HPP4_9CAUL|nr:hypothetical protein [Asticcacaulis aquaticus]MDC7682045.1 hypothetical protein [Asticcacaulis aquaticus]
MNFWRFTLVASGAACLLTPLSACAGRSEKLEVVESRPADTANAKSRDDESISDVAKKSAADVGDGFGDAISAPLVDLNLKRKAIPPVLMKAAKNTYDLTGMDKCEAIAGEVALLDDVLGADFDEAPGPERSMKEKGGKAASDATLTAVRSAATDFIPMRGLVRKMTGAERHQKDMDRALAAGHVRRAYLKGVGMNKNCAPPAAPSWFVPKQIRVTVEELPDTPEPKPLPIKKKK